jgi:hypothetical protein
MREQFDKKLVNKIKSSFKELEGEFDPIEWDKFSKIYFRKKVSPFSYWIKWVSGIAAAAAIGFVLYSINPNKQNTSTDVQDQIAENNKSEIPEDKIEESLKPEAKTSITDQEEKANADQVNIGSKAKVPDQKAEGDKFLAVSKDPFVVQKELDVAISPSGKENMDLNLTQNNFLENTSAPFGKRDLLEPVIGKPEMTQQEAINQIEIWKGENNIASSETVLKESSSKDPMKIGVLISPQTISNSTQSVNFGAGLMSELSFSKKLKLDLGLAYAQQSISPGSGDNNIIAEASDNLGGASLKSASFTGNLINASTELNFGQFEIPINLKYKVMDKKESGIYLVSGLSNMVYVNQQEVTTFNSANISTANFLSNPQTIQTFSQTVEPEPGTSGIDTGRMLNFGVGFEQNLKNGTFILIEPFYKMPLGDQTFINQQFSIGGVNLRMNFQLKTKKQ